MLLEYGLHKDRGVLLECRWDLNLGQSKHYTHHLVEKHGYLTVLDRHEHQILLDKMNAVKSDEKVLIYRTDDPQVNRGKAFLSSDADVKNKKADNLLLSLTKKQVLEFRHHTGQPYVVLLETFELFYKGLAFRLPSER